MPHLPCFQLNKPGLLKLKSDNHEEKLAKISSLDGRYEQGKFEIISLMCSCETPGREMG